MRSNPVAHNGGLARKALVTQLPPELSGIVTSLVPALFEIFAMSIDRGGALGRFSLRESMGTNPAPNSPHAEAATARDVTLGNALAYLLHNCLITCETGACQRV